MAILVGYIIATLLVLVLAVMSLVPLANTLEVIKIVGLFVRVHTSLAYLAPADDALVGSPLKAL